MLPGPRHRGLTTLFTCPLNGNEEGSKCLMVLRVKPTPTRFPTNSLYTPMDNTPLHTISNVCHPWGCCCRRGQNFFVIHYSHCTSYLTARDYLYLADVKMEREAWPLLKLEVTGELAGYYPLSAIKKNESRLFTELHAIPNIQHIYVAS